MSKMDTAPGAEMLGGNGEGIGVGLEAVACNDAADATTPADGYCKTWVEESSAFSGCLVVLHMLQEVSIALSLI